MKLEGLFCPLTPIGSIPPRFYPPRWSFGKELIGLVIMGIGAKIIEVVRNLWPLRSDTVVWRTVLELLVLATCSFAVVSKFFLERRKPFASRYQPHANVSKEFAKLLLIQPFLCLGVVIETLPYANIWLYTAGAFAGLHFVFLDNFQLLQSFGCKIVQPMGWRKLSKSEFLLGMGIAGTVVGLFLVHLKYWLSSFSAVKLIMIEYLMVLTILWEARAWRTSKDFAFHSHHYFNFFLLLPLTRYPYFGSVVLQSFAWGSMTEGISCWGMDPLFHNPMYNRQVCYATQFWTTLLLTLDEDRKRWKQALADLFAVCNELEKQRWGQGKVRTLIQSKQKEIWQDMTNLGEMQPASKAIVSLLSREHWSEEAFLAWVDCVLVGLLLGSNDLQRMGPQLLKLNTMERTNCLNTFNVHENLAHVMAELIRQQTLEIRDESFVKRQCDICIHFNNLNG